MYSLFSFLYHIRINLCSIIIEIRMITVLNTINNNPSWKKIEKRIQTRRAILENNRKINYNKTKDDIDRIYKRELEFTKVLLKAIIPIDIHIDKDMKKNIEDNLPIKFKVSDLFNDFENEEENENSNVEILEKIDKLNLDNK